MSVCAHVCVCLHAGAREREYEATVSFDIAQLRFWVVVDEVRLR